EEILIDGTENSFLFGATNARFRFVFDSDNTNRADGYPTTFDGFIFDDFKVISIDIPCVVSVPTGVESSNITETDATITWDNIPSASYDLRYREVGAQSWTEINGLTTPNSTLTGLANLTDYEVQIRANCGTNNSAYTVSDNFTTLDVQLNYCASAGRNVNDEFISKVELNTINNSSGAQFYSDFTNISTTLTKDSQYSITITPTWTGTVYNEAYSVWIDYNRDGDFLDAGEQVFTQGNTQATSVSGSFTIPSNAVENSTRMRVSMKYNAIPTSCESFQYGEVEDYTVIIEGSGPDVVPPVITLNGAASIDLNVGDVYVEQGATAVDDLDGDITANIVIGGDVVNTGTGGTYEVTYDVNDAAGNPALQVTRTVNVIPDTIAPIILLNGASIVNLNVGDIYTEQGATASDNIDGDISSNISIGGDIVDTNLGGTYLVTYDVIDAAGNTATQVVRTVNVIPDTTAPIITLNGVASIDLNVGDIYVEQGATAVDDLDGDITANIVIGGDVVNTNIVGTYNVTYNVSDNAGNAAVQLNRIVNVLPDVTAPIITLNGSSSISLNVGDVYIEQGATALDNLDGDITADIVITDNVNTLIAGTYFVDYNVSDASGNLANTVTRTVNVIADTVVPTLALIGSATINLNVGDIYNEQGATASDNIDGDITANIVIGGDTVNTNLAGTYIVTYNVSDASGNAATQLNRTVVVSPVTIGCSGGIAAFPYTEGFENTLGAWTQSSSDDLNWLIDANGTPSSNTGPSSATQGSYYLYVEASGNGSGYPNKRAILTSPCFDLSALTQATFSFKYHMFGASDMGTIALEISDDEGATWTSLWTESGNKGNSWQTVSINLSAYVGGGIQLRFNRFVGSTWQADIAIDDISLIDEEITIDSCTGGITSYPYAESFENTLGGWTQSTADDINWTIDANGTPSSGTGPSSAITGSYYIYVEASGNGTGYPNKRAIINSPCYDLTSVVSPIFSFSYHMYGSSNMGTIALEASNDDGLSWTTLWSESGNKGNSWQLAVVDLSAYAGNSVQLRFNRVTGSTWQADIAIDNISLDAGSAAAKDSVKDKFNTDLNTLTLYPNPVKDLLNLKTLKVGEVSYRIINSLGQIVLEGKTGDRVVVDRLEAGMYFIEVTQGKDIMMKRFIKE
ncbi:putative secreted protein (Por secretion system target), partial [Jejuia pallidilutea]